MLQGLQVRKVKYWIGVVSRDHVMLGVRDGIMQLGHGKKAPLARLKKDDWLIYYSSVGSFAKKDMLQSFTALGQIADDDISQFKTSEGFTQFRRRVNYLKAKETPIRPLIEDLDFIKSKQSWGYVF
jgi:hypothetical protein